MADERARPGNGEEVDPAANADTEHGGDGHGGIPADDETHAQAADEPAAPPSPTPDSNEADTPAENIPTATRSDPPSPHKGPQVPGYTLVREISRGGQGAVFEGVSEKTGRKVAVKLLHTGALATDAQHARFEREVRVLTALDHPNIVQVIDRGEIDDGAMFLVMSYVSGKPLDKWITGYYERHPEGPPPSDPMELLRVFLKIADAVNAAHLRGIVHRDLKPANILVDDHDEPHVLDFGLAHPGLDVSRAGELTVTGHFVGSLPWASPEQAEGDSTRIDTRTDVYALGVILYEMLTNGRFPYQVVGNMAQVLNNIIGTEPKPPSVALSENHVADTAKRTARRRLTARGTSGLNPIIEAIVLKALAKRRDDRYQTAGELARDITSYLSGKPTIAFGEPPAPALWPKLAAAAAVLALVAVMGTSWLTRDGGETPPAADEPTVTGVADADGPADASPPDHLADRPMTIHEMHAALKEANPDYTGEGQFKVSDGRIVFARLDDCNITNLSPLADTQLRTLLVRDNRISDLSPLADLPLEVLLLGVNAVTDLEPLRGMPLQRLSIGYGPNNVRDLDPLRDMPLIELILTANDVRDLSPLKGMPLEILDVRYNSAVADLSPLRGLPLQELRLAQNRIHDFEPIANLPLAKLMVGNDQVQPAIETLIAAGNNSLETLDIRGPIEDISFLEGLQLEELTFNRERVEQGLDVLRDMPTLQRIEDRSLDRGAMPAEAFWAKIDGAS